MDALPVTGAGTSHPPQIHQSKEAQEHCQAGAGREQQPQQSWSAIFGSASTQKEEAGDQGKERNDLQNHQPEFPLLL
ncbi:hypothetical protein [Hydrocarboniclastica marina]|uniref:hypothetical protein n=1 Tax=Hydrocarboniclastica marina TaxID=2259620 RepID=UPI0010A882EB|nr:hypothetical protein [Hydrocarboniclastica marina]